MRQFLSAIAQSLGFVPRRKGKSVLVWGTSLGGFARARPILSELSKRNPRLNIYHLCPSPSLRSQLAAEGLASDVVAAPARFGPWMQLNLLRSRAQLLIVVDEPDKEATQLIDRAAARDIPVVAGPLPGHSDESTEPTQLDNWRSQVDLFIVFDEASAAKLYRLGVEPDKVLRFGSPQDAAVMAATAVVDALQPLIAVKRMPRGLGATGGRGRRGGLPADPSSSLLSPFLRWKYRSITALEELKAELGHPETIMCLGNGPSSEDPRLGDLHYDALFRVNHFWLPRDFLTEPQVVFTGVRAAIKAVDNPVIFAFQTCEEEWKLMLKCLPLPRRIAFATAERLGVMDFGDFGVFTPTNGAVMLATAVALQPKRLVVAGMDLFQHPAGSYPGDSTTPNAYTVLHDRDTELHFILSRFDRFEGELVILSEVLDGHWRAHNEAGSEHTAKSGP
jgi:hypothetical protein